MIQCSSISVDLVRTTFLVYPSCHASWYRKEGIHVLVDNLEPFNLVSIILLQFCSIIVIRAYTHNKSHIYDQFWISSSMDYFTPSLSIHTPRGGSEEGGGMTQYFVVVVVFFNLLGKILKFIGIGYLIYRWNSHNIFPRCTILVHSSHVITPGVAMYLLQGNSPATTMK